MSAAASARHPVLDRTEWDLVVQLLERECRDLPRDSSHRHEGATRAPARPPETHRSPARPPAAAAHLTFTMCHKVMPCLVGQRHALPSAQALLFNVGQRHALPSATSPILK